MSCKEKIASCSMAFIRIIRSRYQTFSLIILVPVSVVKWLDYTPQWCIHEGRVKIGQGKTADECKAMCKEGCRGVEWWETNTLACYNCTDPSKKEPYNSENDRSYPPHVFLKTSS